MKISRFLRAFMICMAVFAGTAGICATARNSVTSRGAVVRVVAPEFKTAVERGVTASRVATDSVHRATNVGAGNAAVTSRAATNTASRTVAVKTDSSTTRRAMASRARLARAATISNTPYIVPNADVQKYVYLEVPAELQDKYTNLGAYVALSGGDNRIRFRLGTDGKFPSLVTLVQNMKEISFKGIKGPNGNLVVGWDGKPTNSSVSGGDTYSIVEGLSCSTDNDCMYKCKEGSDSKCEEGQCVCKCREGEDDCDAGMMCDIGTATCVPSTQNRDNYDCGSGEFCGDCEYGYHDCDDTDKTCKCKVCNDTVGCGDGEICVNYSCVEAPEEPKYRNNRLPSNTPTTEEVCDCSKPNARTGMSELCNKGDAGCECLCTPASVIEEDESASAAAPNAAPLMNYGDGMSYSAKGCTKDADCGGYGIYEYCDIKEHTYKDINGNEVRESYGTCKCHSATGFYDTHVYVEDDYLACGVFVNHPLDFEHQCTKDADCGKVSPDSDEYIECNTGFGYCTKGNCETNADCTVPIANGKIRSGKCLINPEEDPQAATLPGWCKYDNVSECKGSCQLDNCGPNARLWGTGVCICNGGYKVNAAGDGCDKVCSNKDDCGAAGNCVNGVCSHTCGENQYYDTYYGKCRCKLGYFEYRGTCEPYENNGTALCSNNPRDLENGVNYVCYNIDSNGVVTLLKKGERYDTVKQWGQRAVAAYKGNTWVTTQCIAYLGTGDNKQIVNSGYWMYDKNANRFGFNAAHCGNQSGDYLFKINFVDTNGEPVNLHINGLFENAVDHIIVNPNVDYSNIIKDYNHRFKYPNKDIDNLLKVIRGDEDNKTVFENYTAGRITSDGNIKGEQAPITGDLYFPDADYKSPTFADTNYPTQYKWVFTPAITEECTGADNDNKPTAVAGSIVGTRTVIRYPSDEVDIEVNENSDLQRLVAQGLVDAGELVRVATGNTFWEYDGAKWTEKTDLRTCEWIVKDASGLCRIYNYEYWEDDRMDIYVKCAEAGGVNLKDMQVVYLPETGITNKYDSRSVTKFGIQEGLLDVDVRNTIMASLKSEHDSPSGGKCEPVGIFNDSYKAGSSYCGPEPYSSCADYGNGLRLEWGEFINESNNGNTYNYTRYLQCGVPHAVKDETTCASNDNAATLYGKNCVATGWKCVDGYRALYVPSSPSFSTEDASPRCVAEKYLENVEATIAQNENLQGHTIYPVKLKSYNKFESTGNTEYLYVVMYDATADTYSSYNTNGDLLVANSDSVPYNDKQKIKIYVKESDKNKSPYLQNLIKVSDGNDYFQTTIPNVGNILYKLLKENKVDILGVSSSQNNGTISTKDTGAWCGPMYWQNFEPTDGEVAPYTCTGYTGGVRFGYTCSGYVPENVPTDYYLMTPCGDGDNCVTVYFMTTTEAMSLNQHVGENSTMALNCTPGGECIAADTRAIWCMNEMCACRTEIGAFVFPMGWTTERGAGTVKYAFNSDISGLVTATKNAGKNSVRLYPVMDAMHNVCSFDDGRSAEMKAAMGNNYFGLIRGADHMCHVNCTVGSGTTTHTWTPDENHTENVTCEE